MHIANSRQLELIFAPSQQTHLILRVEYLHSASKSLADILQIQDKHKPTLDLLFLTLRQGIIACVYFPEAIVLCRSQVSKETSTFSPPWIRPAG